MLALAKSKTRWIVVSVITVVAALLFCSYRNGMKEGFSASHTLWYKPQRCTISSYNVMSSDNTAVGALNEWRITDKNFINKVNIAAVHSEDWKNWQYKVVRVSATINGRYKTADFQIWDYCRDKDCVKGDENCCTNNKRMNNNGFLLDLESAAVKRIWGMSNSENHLLQDASFKLVGSGSNYEAIAKKWGARRW